MSEKQLQQWIDNFFMEQLLEDFDQLVKNMVKDEMNETGDFNFYQQLDEMEKALSILVTKQDQSLKGAVGSSINSMKKALADEGKF